VLLLCSKSRFA